MEDTASRSGEEDDVDESAQSVASLPSSSRQQRNQAEKKRRDTLNQFINELAMLVPMVSASHKKLDKTSILRLAAAYLRLHQTIAKSKEEFHRLSIPIQWCQQILDGMDGILLVVTSSGKIVFISHNIETLLGHSQIDLMGQSLFNITSLEDHDELKANLNPSLEDLDRPSTSNAIAGSGSESSANKEPERRSFYLRLRHKSTPRGEQPQYEVVHVVGHLRTPPPPSSSKKNPPGTSSSSEVTQHMSHDVVLVGMMKPFKEIRITSSSFIEASREEWISRHLIDGTIVFADHRISVVSGYMAEEVTGDFAFKFMHQDDVRWVLIALRQMYYRGESYGKSCYRIMSKTGDYIYLRTHGYLELNEDTHSVQSFVCINTLVSKDEGEKLIKEMKEMYTPMVTGQDSSVATLTTATIRGSDVLTPLKVDDPDEMNEAIEQLLSGYPNDQIHPKDSDIPAGDEQFAKCAMVARNSLPKLQVHCSQIGLSNMPRIKKFSRPSVIHRAKEKRTSGDDQSSSKKIRPESSDPSPASSLSDVHRSVIKSRDEYMDVESSDDSNLIPTTLSLNRYSSASPSSYVSSPPSGYVLTSPSTDHVGYLESPVDPSCSVVLDSASSSSTSNARQPVDLFNWCPSLNDPMDDTLQVGNLDTLGLDIYRLGENDMDTIDEGVVRNHLQLEQQIQYQDSQFTDIEENLTLVNMSTEGNHCFRSTVTHLKAEHMKQKQMLKTLKEDHQNIQHNKEHLSVRGAQDIGA